MGALLISDPPAFRYAPYIEELHDFLATSGLRYGTPDDIFAVTERLHASEAFSADLSSMVRSVILREGGAMPHAQLLEILALAIGGPQMESAPQSHGQPLRQLLAFVTGVLRRPWNVPPGEWSEVVPFPPESAPKPTAPAVQTAPHGQGFSPEPSAPLAQTAAVPPPPAPALPTELAETKPATIPVAPLESPIANAPPPHYAEFKPVVEPRRPFSTFALWVRAPQQAAPPEPSQTRAPAPSPATSPRTVAIVGFGATLIAVMFALILATRPISSDRPAPRPSATPPAAAASTPFAALPQLTSTTLQAGATHPSSPPPPVAVGKLRTAGGNTEYITAPTFHSYIAQPNPPQKSSGTSETVSAPYNSAASAAATGPLSSATQSAYRDPDSSLAGDPRPVRPTSPSSYLKVSSGVMTANILSAPRPDYPTLARLTHVQGQVILQAVVAKDGSVSSTRVLRGNRLLRGAAAAAVSRWRYRPYHIDGRPVDVATIVTVDFQR